MNTRELLRAGRRASKQNGMGCWDGMGPTTRMACLVFTLSGLCGSLAQTTGDWRSPRVIVIGVDGLSVDGVATAPTPRLHELMSRGAWTLEARGVMPTLSSPNWESAIGGAPPEQHGIISNGYLRKMVEFEPACRNAEGKYPTIFGVLRDQQPASSIAVFHNWRGFAHLIETGVTDVLKHESTAAGTVYAAIQYWRQYRPALMFIHLDNVDHAGHDAGWMSRGYYQAVAAADVSIGRVLEMLDQEAAWDSTLVLIISDHGGTQHGHGKNSLAEIQIPWILAGPEVVPGRIGVPVRIYDTAATLAWIFNLETPPCWVGRPVLAAFRQTSVAAKSEAGRWSQRGCAAPLVTTEPALEMVASPPTK
jgi:hypothetical protein